MRTRRSIPIALGVAALAAPATAQSPVLFPHTGHYYEAIAVPGGIPWDQAQAAAQQLSYQGVPGHLATVADDEENQWLYATLGGMPLDRYWIGLWQDPNDPGFYEPDGGWVWVTGEPYGYTSWFPGEPNNWAGTEHYAAFDHLGPTWNDVAIDWGGNAGYIVEYDVGSGIAYCFGDGSGTICPCGNSGASGAGCANSSGAGAVLVGGGSTSVSIDTLTMNGSNLIPGQPALCFAGLNAVNNGDGVLFGDGLRCAGGGVVRLGVVVPGAGGAATWGPGLGASGGWVAGDVRRFQAWYRDPAGSPCGYGFNLSNGVEISFTP